MLERKSAESFNLVRYYAVLSLCSIGIVSLGSALLMHRFLTTHILERDAVISMEFIQSVSQINDPAPYFNGGKTDSDRGQLEEFFLHITRMPDVLRANVYTRDQSIIWSSEDALIGQRFDDNPDLIRALEGHLVFEREYSLPHKEEHATLPTEASIFLESYVPIWDRTDLEVIGVVEVYKAPTALLEALQNATWLIASIAIGSGVFLFVTLFWLVRRASLIISRQRDQLIESETMSTVGEMSSAVAHRIRNPLAAIRSSAELTLETDSLSAAREAAGDVIFEADRLAAWVRELLLFSQIDEVRLGPVPVAEIAQEVLDDHARVMGGYGVKARLDIEPNVPPIHGDRVLLGQVLASVVSNALDAMPEGGLLKVVAVQAGGAVELSVTDTGAGIDEAGVAQVFKPFFTSKVDGLGLGLPLARRLIGRIGGEIALTSRKDSGTTVTLRLRASTGL